MEEVSKTIVYISNESNSDSESGEEEELKINCSCSTSQTATSKQGTISNNIEDTIY